MVAFAVLFGQRVMASPQLPDYIIYKGDTLAVYDLILEEYLTKIKTPDQGDLFGLKFRDNASFNCWRGYQAVFIIENDSLFLTHIIQCGELRFSKEAINQERSKERIRNIFGDRLRDSKVFVDWYSGKIGLPKGNLLRWDGVFYKIFENEMLVEIEKGKVVNISYVSNYEDNPRGINRKYGDEISSILFHQLKKVKWESNDKYDPSEKYLITIGKNGRVCNVHMLEYQSKDSVDKYWDKKEYRYCIKTILKCLKKLQFDVIKKHGEPIEENVFIEIWLNDDGTLENWTK